MPKNLMISAKILENWSISAIRYAFPAQLRPRRGKKVHPSFAAACLNFTNISQGQVETIRKALRHAVMKRCARNKDLLAPAVTIEDVHHVYQKLCHMQESETRRHRMQEMHRSKRVTFQSQAQGEDESVEETEMCESDTESISTTSNWPTALQYITGKRIAIPETPSRRLFSNDVFGSAPTDSYTVFGESSLRASRQTVSATDDVAWNEVQEQKLKTVPGSRKAVLEAKIRSLLEQESEYIRLAKEHRAKAEQHQQEAVETRKKIEEMEAELIR